MAQQNDDNIDPSLYKALRKAIRDDGDPAQVKRIFREHPEMIRVETGLGLWLHYAALSGRLNVVEMLLSECGFSANDIDERGERALNAAIRNGHIDVARYLLNHGAEFDLSNAAQNPLFTAIYNRQLDIAELLIERGIDVNVRHTGERFKNWSAADFARDIGALEFLPLLEATGADITAAPSEPKVPVDPATAEQTVYDFFDVSYGMDEVHPQLVTQLLHLSPPIKVYVLPPWRENPVVYCFTAGLSSRAMNTPPEGAEYAYAELFIVLPPECYDERQGLAEPYHWIAEWMVRITTQMHECDTCLGGPLTIIANDHPPQPLGPQVKFTSWLLLADQTEKRSDGQTVWFYRMVPLFTKERDFEVQHGMRALLDRFDEKKLSLVTDLKRSCLC